MTQDEVRVLVRETVRETLETLGIDTEHPLNAQANFRWLDKTRKTSEKFGSSVMLAAIIGLFGFLGALVWAGVEHTLTKNGQ